MKRRGASIVAMVTAAKGGICAECPSPGTGDTWG